jgi:hypothetical protein
MADTVELFSIKDGTVKKIPIGTALFEIYYLRYRVPTEAELKLNGIETTVDEIKKLISSNENYIPLYDAYTFNIYIVQKRNVYIRVVNHDYRFPDELIIKSINAGLEHKLSILKKKPELEDDKVFTRSIRKANLMLDFMNQIDNEILYNTYLSVFYRYAPEIGNATYTCIRRSFIPHKGHLKPYYTKDEIIKLGMNMEIIKLQPGTAYIDFKDSLTREDYLDMCSKIQLNDVSAEILIQHQNYIVENDLVGLIQYYTIQGSYFMNQYLRGMTKYEYRNEYLEDNIEKLWSLVIRSPPFDNDYILYRFVNTDSYIRNLRVGDTFIDAGFTSTTRDPYYRNDLYKFGFILIKIKIPKGIIGVGLCLETISHFPQEEEIILPPESILRLVSKDDDCEYYHPDESFVSNIKTRYEFEWIGNNSVKFRKRVNLPRELATKMIDFITIEKVRTMSVKEKVDYLVKKNFDPMNRIKCRIGEHTFYVVAEWYDSTGSYEEMYSIKTSEGFSLYSIHNGYILFMIEIGEIDGYPQIKVNYYTKYSRLNRRNIMGDDNFIKFISSIAFYFDTPNVTIYADYMSCDKPETSNDVMSNIKDITRDMRGIAKTNLSNNLSNKSSNNSSNKSSNNSSNKSSNKSSNISSNKIQRGGEIVQTNVDNNVDIDTRSFESFDLIDSPYRAKKQRTFIVDEDTRGMYDRQKRLSYNADVKVGKSDKYVGIIYDEGFKGGSYCLDFYRYLKFNEKRYFSTSTLTAELQPKFSYYDLDVLKTADPFIILKKEDRDEIYQIYSKNYEPDSPKNKKNLADFYIWMIENKCYLMDIFVNKMDRLYKDDNPFKKGMYTLDAMAYLYNRRFVNTYSRYIKMSIDEEHVLLNLPKNEYRIRR